MLRLLASTALTVLGNAIGLIAASILFEGFTLDGVGFFTSILFFTIAQVILAPFVMKLSIQYLPAIRGGITLVTIFVVLILTTTFTAGVRIDELSTWILSPLVIWLTTVIAGIVLPMVIFKKTLQKTRNIKQ